MHDLEGLAEPARGQAQAAAGLAHPVGDEALEVVAVADLGDVAPERGELQLDDVPLTRDEALERDAASGDDLPARADSDVARARTDGPSGEVPGPTPRSGGPTT